MQVAQVLGNIGVGFRKGGEVTCSHSFLSPADAPMFHLQQAYRNVKLSLDFVGNAVRLSRRLTLYLDGFSPLQV